MALASIISDIVTPDSVSNKLRDYYKSGVYTVIGTQTTDTGTWTGALHGVPALYDGLTIMYYLPRAGSGNATLNLTLDDGTTTGAIACYYSTSRLTTHYGKGCNIVMTYWSAGSISIDGTATTNDRWIANANYDTNTTTENRIGYFAGKTGAVGIWATGLFMMDPDGTYQSICTASDGTVTANNRTTDTTKIANTHGFRPFSPIWYCNTTYNANTNIGGSGAVYSSVSVIDSRYAFNTELVVNSLTPYKPLYLVGTLSNVDGLFYLDSTWWTQTPTDPTKIYILVGGVYDSTASNCRITLYEQNRWYEYHGTKLYELAGNAFSVNGHIVNSDVPSGALFTDTKNTAGATDTSSKIFLIGATAQSANPQTYSDDQVYATSGVLTTKSVQVGVGTVTMQYNGTKHSVEFIVT
jgi:hypothetical protein